MRVTSDQSHWWVGLYRDTWRWSHQSNSSLRVWSNNEPSGGGREHCVGTHVRGWFDASCGLKIPFICSGKCSNFMPINEPIFYFQ